jgi:phosphopantothenoylcysteine decarboxylase/phosphopantothenate--cysteine ligase
MANILFVLTGSIACYKACDAISQLVQRGHAVRAVATEAALRFVGTATLEGLTRQPVAIDLFAPGEALDHITLSRWANLTVVCPATAHMLNRLSAGLGDDLASTLLLAHDWQKPLLIAPAMNPAMWSHPATKASVERLRGWGARFVSPGDGRTACGEVGEGRLAEPVDIIAAIDQVLAPPGRRLRVLVTSGGTSEPIDGVRVLTNTSTGATGALIASHFARAGHEVVLVRATSAVHPATPCVEDTFTTFAELEGVLDRRLQSSELDVIIHAAAVSDFSVAEIETDGTAWTPGLGKMPSVAAPVIRLRRNPKLLDSFRARSRNPSLRVVAFKLTRDASPEAARAAVMGIFNGGAADFVVHNDLSQQSVGGVFPADIWRADGSIAAHCVDRTAIAIELERLLTPS